MVSALLRIVVGISTLLVDSKSVLTLVSLGVLHKYIIMYQQHDTMNSNILPLTIAFKVVISRS